jgi:dihydrofolate synthase / folylpolyglutamate synthase
MNYQQTLDYLFSQLPIFHRIGAAAYKANLDNTTYLCKVLGNPEKKFKSVHIAGTNGKGSVSNMIASVLQTSGYKTGLYTSPHLKDFRERIRINGKKIPRSKIVSFVSTYRKSFESIQPSFFEYTFGMAVKYFADDKVDIAVIETGMGGRLDSTNVVNSIVSVITNIGLDHTQFLGDTPAKIASEKAGIIKPGVPVIIGQTQESVLSVFQKTAKRNQSKLHLADKNFEVINTQRDNKSLSNWQMEILKNGGLYLKDLKCPLTGNYQLKNIVTSIQVIEVLMSLGYSIGQNDILNGIRNVIKNTGLQGRWQVLGKSPLIICDTGHNFNGLKEVVAQLKEMKYKKLHFVIGFVKDKDIIGILKLLPKKANYYFCKANIPRGLDQDELLKMSKLFRLTGASYKTVNEAFMAAKEKADDDDLIFVGGSTFVVAEVL